MFHKSFLAIAASLMTFTAFSGTIAIMTANPSPAYAAELACNRYQLA